jgi:hypothetical protein
MKVIQLLLLSFLFFTFHNANSQTQLTVLEDKAEVAIKKEAEIKKSYNKWEKKYKKIDRKLKKAAKTEDGYYKEYVKASTAAESLRSEGLKTGNADVLKDADKAKSYAKKMDKKFQKAKKCRKKRERQYSSIEPEYLIALEKWEKAYKEKEDAMKRMKAVQNQ